MYHFSFIFPVYGKSFVANFSLIGIFISSYLKENLGNSYDNNPLALLYYK